MSDGVTEPEDEPTPEQLELLRNAYQSFNARDIDAAVALMDADVDWPNALEGGRVHGHEGVREYWERQFRNSDPWVEPKRFWIDGDGMLVAEVHQTVMSLEGKVVSEQTVEHAYRMRGGLIGYMEVRHTGR